MSRVIAVVGGGITGLYTAHLARVRNPEARVIVVEQSPVLGGLLRSFDYGENGVFDIGVHTFYETNNAEIDGFFQSILPEEEWKYMVDYDRDLAGSWHEGKIQYNTPYIDVSNLDEKRRERMREDFFAALEQNAANDKQGKSAVEYARGRFGNAIAEEIIAPSVSAKQHVAPEDVHPFAMTIQGLDRVSLLTQEDVEKLIGTDGFQGQLAFPDQRKYPKKFLSGKRAYYPARFGLGPYIDRVCERLREENIEIFTSAKLGDFVHDGESLTNATLTDKDGNSEVLDIQAVYWSVGVPALAMNLGLTMPETGFDPPNQTVICSLLADKKPHCGDAYYAFFHGHDRIHRISFGYNYSDEHTAGDRFPICVEMIYPHSASTETVEEDTERWLREAGVVQDGNMISFRKAEVLPSGYPVLSRRNVEGMMNLHEQVADLGLSNLTSVGILARDDLLFQFDLIQHAYEVVQ